MGALWCRSVAASTAFSQDLSVWLWIHSSCRELCFISQMNVFMWEKTCETQSKIKGPDVYLFLLQETMIYFTGGGRGGGTNVSGYFSKFGLVAISQNLRQTNALLVRSVCSKPTRPALLWFTSFLSLSTPQRQHCFHRRSGESSQ